MREPTTTKQPAEQAVTCADQQLYGTQGPHVEELQALTRAASRASAARVSAHASKLLTPCPCR